MVRARSLSIVLYDTLQGPAGTSSWIVMTAGPTNSNEFTGTSRTRYFMESETTYQWNIRARDVDENGSTTCQSPWSETKEFTTYLIALILLI